MPLQIIRQDITKMQVDAIVNPTNTLLIPTGGTDLAIHNAAGAELSEYCRSLGSCPVGTAKISPAFSLPCSYIIHTVGPLWNEEENPEELLISCYKSCLDTAKQNNLQSIAFPLISSGAFGYPKDKVLRIAVSTITAFLCDNEMTVYLLVYDKSSYELSEKLFGSIENYISHTYSPKKHFNYKSSLFRRSSEEKAYSDEICECSSAAALYDYPPCIGSSEKKQSLEDFINLDEGFSEKLLKLMDAKGIGDVQCYKRANVSKQTWHKLITDKDYRPNKKTAISFAIALELSLEETQSLLSTLGFILSDSSLFDVIIKYCLENEIYDVFEIDSALFKYDQETLFSTI